MWKNNIFAGNKFFAFNVWDIKSAVAVIDTSLEMNIPIFLQVSASVYSQIDVKGFIDFTKEYIARKNAKVILHLDHSKNVEQIFEAIDLGWDSVMFDGSTLSLEDNISNTNQVSNYAKKENILVEAELGIIGNVKEHLDEQDKATIPTTMIEEFIRATNIDMLAIPIGTAHGQYNDEIPVINHAFIKEIDMTFDIPLVVHGGSELPLTELEKLIQHQNVKKINISTDIKQAYRKGILDSEKNNLLIEEGFNALLVEREIYKSIKNVVKEKLTVLEMKDG